MSMDEVHRSVALAREPKSGTRVTKESQATLHSLAELIQRCFAGQRLSYTVKQTQLLVARNCDLTQLGGLLWVNLRMNREAQPSKLAGVIKAWLDTFKPQTECDYLLFHFWKVPLQGVTVMLFEPLTDD